MYHFWVTVTLTSGLDFRIIVSEALYPVLFELEITNLVCGCILGWQSVPSFGSLTATNFLELSFQERVVSV